jgi:riboflavin kinase/FMN adenylyltransferase
VVRSAKYGFGVGNLGVRPTFPVDRPHLEVFFFDDFKGNLYGEVVEVDLLSFLREERRFSSVEELKSQVMLDIDQAKSFAASYLIHGVHSARMV